VEILSHGPLQKPEPTLAVNVMEMKPARSCQSESWGQRLENDFSDKP
jgi:hypothetical protein